MFCLYNTLGTTWWYSVLTSICTAQQNKHIHVSRDQMGAEGITDPQIQQRPITSTVWWHQVIQVPHLCAMIPLTCHWLNAQHTTWAAFLVLDKKRHYQLSRTWCIAARAWWTFTECFYGLKCHEVVMIVPFLQPLFQVSASQYLEFWCKILNDLIYISIGMSPAC